MDLSTRHLPTDGKLIVIEGIDGSGKSTLAKQIISYLQNNGYVVQQIRRYMLPELTRLWYRLVEQDIASQEIGINLAVADYFSGLERYIKPALQNGEIIVADRYFYSHMIYFGLRGVNLGRIKKMFYDAVSPDIVFYMSVSIDEAIKRLRTRMQPNFWEAGLDYQLGMSIGEAYKTFQETPSGQQKQLLEEKFRNHHSHALSLYPKLLPIEQTFYLDAHLPTDELMQTCLRKLDRILPLHVH